MIEMLLGKKTQGQNGPSNAVSVDLHNRLFFLKDKFADDLFFMIGSVSTLNWLLKLKIEYFRENIHFMVFINSVETLQG